MRKTVCIEKSTSASRSLKKFTSVTEANGAEDNDGVIFMTKRTPIKSGIEAFDSAYPKDTSLSRVVHKKFENDISPPWLSWIFSKF